MSIEYQLAELSNNFTEQNGAVKCYTEVEKDQAKEIFNKYYDIVEISDGRKSDNDRLSYIIAYSNPKELKETLNEADKDAESELSEDEFLNELDELDSEDISMMDNPDNDTDLSDLDVGAVDDASEVEEADQLTILKKRAHDTAEKWKDLFKQISDLAKDLDLVATHNDELEIELVKADGAKADVEQDLETINTELENELDSLDDEIDDDFGPSGFEDRAQNLKDEPVGESLEQAQNISINESSVVNVDPNELHISEDEIDDDF